MIAFQTAGIPDPGDLDDHRSVEADRSPTAFPISRCKVDD